MRPTADPNTWEFVADADSNFNLPKGLDKNEDGVVDEADEAVWPGLDYDVEGSRLADEGLIHPVYEDELLFDQWGTFISGSAPIFDSTGNGVAIIALDISVDDLYEATKQRFRVSLAFLLILLLLTVSRTSYLIFVGLIRKQDTAAKLI